jgi:hypothetical protein
MDLWRQAGSLGDRAHWIGAAAAALLVLVPVSGSVLRALAGTTAGVLLAIVMTAAAHEDHRQRAVSRHQSIRADIAAGGGLSRRLMV